MIVRHDFRVMGGPAHILIGLSGGLHQADAQALARVAEGEAFRIEQKYSRYQPNSWLSVVNRAAGSANWHLLDSETEHLLQLSQSMFERSEGAFDITVAAFYRVWNACVDAPPTQSALRSAATRVGWTKVERSPDQTAFRLPEGMQIDFGGLGKEYAADRVAQVLMEAGVCSGLVNLAGDLMTIGAKPDGSPWRLGVQHPMHADQLLATIPLVNLGMATSGGYERYRMLGGRRYAHVLDARTGWPVEDWLGVSVVAPSCSQAGCLATLGLLSGSTLEVQMRRQVGAFIALHNSGRVVQRAYDAGIEK